MPKTLVRRRENRYRRLTGTEYATVDFRPCADGGPAAINLHVRRGAFGYKFDAWMEFDSDETRPFVLRVSGMAWSNLRSVIRLACYRNRDGAKGRKQPDARLSVVDLNEGGARRAVIVLTVPIRWRVEPAVAYIASTHIGPGGAQPIRTATLKGKPALVGVV